MRLSCPGCQTEYEVPDAALAGRVRTLRCAHCGHQWEYGPLPVKAVTDPAEADWPGAAPRITPSRPATQAPPEPPPSLATYEPLTVATRDTWPPAPPPEYGSTSLYEPLTAALAETLNDDTTAEPAQTTAEPLPPQDPPEPDTKPAAGNEERFAALVKTSRIETEDPRPGVRAGLFTTIILLGGISAGIWAARFHIMQVWPPSTRLFDAINTIIANITVHH